jgi:hypothetical protein
MGSLRALIESKASLIQIRAFQESCRKEDDQFQTMIQNEALRRRQAVYRWLVGARSVEYEQDRHSQTRMNYPSSGRWLLQHRNFKEWFDPQYATIPPLLWLTGDPGSGEF